MHIHTSFITTIKYKIRKLQPVPIPDCPIPFTEHRVGFQSSQYPFSSRKFAAQKKKKVGKHTTHPCPATSDGRAPDNSSYQQLPAFQIPLCRPMLAEPLLYSKYGANRSLKAESEVKQTSGKLLFPSWLQNPVRRFIFKKLVTSAAILYDH